jgi:hypothetical protein
MDLREIGWGGVDWVHLAQDRDQWMYVVNTVTNLRVPQNVGKFLSGCATGGCSRRAQLHGVFVAVVSLLLLGPLLLHVPRCMLLQLCF